MFVIKRLEEEGERENANTFSSVPRTGIVCAL